MSEAAIQIRGLEKTYAGGKVALHGIDLDVPRGSIFGLLGPNGAGKSTLINILAGLVLKTAGRVEVWGHDIDRETRAARIAIGQTDQAGACIVIESQALQRLPAGALEESRHFLVR